MALESIVTHTGPGATFTLPLASPALTHSPSSTPSSTLNSPLPINTIQLRRSSYGSVAYPARSPGDSPERGHKGLAEKHSELAESLKRSVTIVFWHQVRVIVVCFPIRTSVRYISRPEPTHCCVLNDVQSCPCMLPARPMVIRQSNGKTVISNALYGLFCIPVAWTPASLVMGSVECGLITYLPRLTRSPSDCDGKFRHFPSSASQRSSLSLRLSVSLHPLMSMFIIPMRMHGRKSKSVLCAQ